LILIGRIRIQQSWTGRLAIGRSSRGGAGTRGEGGEEGLPLLVRPLRFAETAKHARGVQQRQTLAQLRVEQTCSTPSVALSLTHSSLISRLSSLISHLSSLIFHLSSLISLSLSHSHLSSLISHLISLSLTRRRTQLLLDQVAFREPAFGLIEGQRVRSVVAKERSCDVGRHLAPLCFRQSL
jgi:hypothetical protein